MQNTANQTEDLEKLLEDAQNFRDADLSEDAQALVDLLRKLLAKEPKELPQSLLQLLAEGLYQGSFARPKDIFAKGCEFRLQPQGKPQAQGRKAVADALLAAVQEFRQREPNFVLYQASIPVPYGERLKAVHCLALCHAAVAGEDIPDLGIGPFFFLERSSKDKISAVILVDWNTRPVQYVFKNKYLHFLTTVQKEKANTFRLTHCSHSYGGGIQVHGIDSVRTIKRSFFASKDSDKMHGDPEAFRGIPICTFPTLLNPLREIEEHEKRYIEESRPGQPFGAVSETGKTPVAGQFRYWDFPDTNAPIRARTVAQINETDSDTVHGLYLFLEGCPGARLQIQATYDWLGTCVGLLAAGPEGGPVLNFIVPSYGPTHEQLVPGATINMAISGITSSVEVRWKNPDPHTIPIPFSRLASSLNGQPDNDRITAQLARDRRMSTSATLTTCLYEIDAPAQEVTEVAFDGVPFLRLLLPMMRTADGSADVRSYIYVRKESSGSSGNPEPGDQVNCMVILCADMIPA